MSEFHLGWFLGPGITIQGWKDPDYPSQYDWTKPHIFQDGARELEKACFDLLILEDTSAVPYTYQGKMDYYLKHAAMTPKFDPAIVTPYIAAVTEKLGVAVTMTTNFYPPWLLARSLATMDHYSSGRIGWNVVTATSDAAAQNYGYPKQIEHDLRYDMADEFVDVCKQLWGSWEPDAVKMDMHNDMFIDPSKVNAVNFAGEHYTVRGPLNVPRGPQGHPVIVAPGGSPRGRKFSGRNAEVVLAQAFDVADMKKYRQQVRAHAAEYGRDPNSMKVMFAVQPVVVGSEAEAEEHKAKMVAMRMERIEHALAAMSFLSGIDFSKFDLDEPLGEIKTNGMQTMLQMFQRYGPQATLRDIMTDPEASGFGALVGTPDAIASQMEEAMQEIGGDGFLITGYLKPTFLKTITEGLVPTLQKRGLTRSDYSAETLRGNLMAF